MSNGPLIDVIRRSVGALRVATEDMRGTPNKQTVARVAEECETVSSAVAALARTTDLAALEKKKPHATNEKDRLDIDLISRFLSVSQFGACEKCGGALNETQQGHAAPLFEFPE